MAGSAMSHTTAAPHPTAAPATALPHAATTPPRAPHHAPEVATLAAALKAAPSSGGATRAGRLLRRIRHVEQATGQSVIELLDALEAAIDRDAEARAAALTEDQAAALISVGADLTARPVAERPSVTTAVAHRQIVDDALSTGEAARLLGVTDGRIRQRVAAGTLIATRVAGTLRLPRFQFTDTGILPGWPAVARTIPDTLPLVAIDTFMRTPQPDLELDGEPATPIDWLAAGGSPVRVAALAGE